MFLERLENGLEMSRKSITKREKYREKSQRNIDINSYRHAKLYIKYTPNESTSVYSNDVNAQVKNPAI